jgi:hypothetical protein
MNIYVDIDNTITKTNGTDYKNSEPVFQNINIINNLYDEGHNITYWTARGSLSGIDYYELTKYQLDLWGAKYHKLILGKPAFDILIDDKTINKIGEELIEWVAREEKKD